MAEIVQSTEHSIVETFVRPGSEKKHWERERCPTCHGSARKGKNFQCPDCREDPGFIQVALPREKDKTGRLKIVIESPTAELLRIHIDGMIHQRDDALGIIISVEGAAALQTSLMRMLNFRQMHVNEAKMPAGTPPDSKPLVHPADRE